MINIINTLGPIFKWIALIMFLVIVIRVLRGKINLDSFKLNSSVVFCILGIFLIVIIIVTTFIIIL